MSEFELPLSIRAYFEAISALDFEKAAACFADPCHHEDPLGSPVNATPGGVKQFLQGLGSLFESVSLFPREVHGQGSEWAIAFGCKGKGRNGAEVVFEGIDIIKLDDADQIRELRAYWNPGPTLAKLMS